MVKSMKKLLNSSNPVPHSPICSNILCNTMRENKISSRYSSIKRRMTKGMRMILKMTMSPIPKVQNHRNISPPSTPTSSMSIRQSPSSRMYSIIMIPRMSPVIKRKGIPFWALIISLKMMKMRSISTKKMRMKCSPKTTICSVTMSTIKNNSSLSHK